MLPAARHSPESCMDCRYRGLRLFCNLSEDALQHLDDIGMHMAFPGRTVIFNEGQQSKAVFVVCEGQLKLTSTSREGRTMILRLSGPGDLLGLSAILNELPYEVTAETLEPTVLKSVRRADFLEFLRAYGEIGAKTAQVLAKEYREVFLDDAA